MLLSCLNRRAFIFAAFTVFAACAAFMLLVPAAVAGRKAEADICALSAQRKAEAASVLEPFWASSRMDRESALFVQRAGAAPAEARLLFIPTRILQVSSNDGSVVYRPGIDYVWKPGTRVLIRTPNSRVPFRTFAELHPPAGAANSYGRAVDGKSSLFYDLTGAIFNRTQVAVTYDYGGRWTGYIPRPAGEQLARTISKLKQKEPIKMAVLGDSIAMGFSASAFFGEPPYQPDFAGLTVLGLEQKYGARVTLENFSVAGKQSAWGARMASLVAGEKPDLMIVAFGMNDATAGVTSAAYARNLHKIVETVRQISPRTEFILVTTMTGNPDWDGANPALYKAYRQDILRMSGPGVAVADMTLLWQELLRRKTFDGLTGNGINHPNDFGFRLYAQVILQLLSVG